jgi:hypothetical protein
MVFEARLGGEAAAVIEIGAAMVIEGNKNIVEAVGGVR